jgi:CheY-like chemotaxis protein
VSRSDKRKPHVLLVEDSVEIREALQEILEEVGYSVISVGSAEEGLEVLKRERLDLVVSDYTLPEHTGAWMLGEAVLAGRLDHDHALLVTAHPSPKTRGFKVMRKPLDFEEFLGRLSGMLDPEPAHG